MLKLSALVSKGTLVAAALLVFAPAASRADEVQTTRVASSPAAASSLVAARLAPQGRIVGGAVIAATSAPYQLYLEGPIGGGRYSCGGSLLSPTTVITAAHCVPGGLTDGNAHPASGMTILAGASNYKAPGPGAVQVNVATYRIHPYYDAVGPTATTGDVAILTLATAITPNGSTIATIPLPTPWTPTTASSPVPTALRVTGYGVTVDGGKDQDGLLRSLDMTAQLDPDDCDDSPENAVLLCAKSASGSSCQGDSGGPLVTAGANPVLVGVVSNGAVCGPNTSDNYVNLFAPENRLWIDAALASVPGFSPPRAPRWAGDPTFSTSVPLKVGGTATCTAGAVTNSPTEQRIEFQKEDGTVLQSTLGATAKMTIPAAAGGARLVCRSLASNAGGTYLSPGLITGTAVPAAAAAPTPAPTPVASGTGIGLGQCPSDLNQSKQFFLGVIVPSSARRGKKMTVTVTMKAPPVTQYSEGLVVKGPRGATGVTVDTVPASTTSTVRDPGKIVGTGLRIKVPRGLKVGRKYTFTATLLIANTADDLANQRVCEFGTRSFKVRIRR